jgi:hypothetical protein
MVKTTVDLDDDIYAEIVRESIERYGSTKNISKIINQRLSGKGNNESSRGKRITFKARNDLATLDADIEISKAWERKNK